jgi:glutathione S-transferase
MQLKLIIGNKNYSSWSLRSWFLLKESDIDFEEYRIPLDQENSAAEIARFSPAGRLPILMLDGQPVWDTLAIAETVAERWPDKELWPADPLARAHARSVSAEMHSGFSTLRDAMPMNCRAMGRKVSCHRRYASKGDWLFGRFSVADSMFAPVVLRFRTYGINLPDSASTYPRRLLESESIQSWLAAAESEVEVIKREEIGQ